MTTFFSTIGDRRRVGTYDKGLELRDPDGAAISATTSETSIKFASRKNEVFRVVVNMAAYTGYTAGSAEWNVSVEVSDVESGTYTQVASLPASAGAGEAVQVPLDISGAEVAALDGDAEYIRVTATKTGAPGDLTYSAFIIPC